MKKVFFGILLLVFLFVFFNKDAIVNMILKEYINSETITLGEPNSYYKNYSYSFVQDTDNFSPKNRQDILNIIYSFLNRGLDEITFYCDDSYTTCIDDFNEIADNSVYLSSINNLVHPYNSYSNIYFTFNNYGKIHISTKRTYSDSDIQLINNRIKEITDSIITDDMSDYEKILTFHDYIVNNTVYDDNIDIYNQSESTNSNNALGLLFDGKAICSGYSDVMAIFLNMYGFNNYKISSNEHIWNLVYIDNSWLHLDATWDDPVTTDGNNVLLHDFFLITTDQLFEKESSLQKNNHQFNSNLYLEA